MRFLRFLALLLLASLPALAQNDHDNGLTITHLTGDAYIYTTYKPINGSPFPSNGMYVVTKEGVVLIDSPWDSTQTLPLLDSIRRRHGNKVLLCITTHYHDDRTAGLDILKKEGVATWSTELTRSLAATSGDREAEHTFTGDTTFNVGGVAFRAYYPGAGHTEDNIVVWLPEMKILYGGCLVKSSESGGLGNVADADVEAWPATIRKLIDLFPNPRSIIPGHNGWEGTEALNHTLYLLGEDVE